MQTIPPGRIVLADWIIVLILIPALALASWLFYFMFASLGTAIFGALAVVLANTFVALGIVGDIFGLKLSVGALLVSFAYVAGAIICIKQNRYSAIKFAYSMAMVVFASSLLFTLGMFLNTKIFDVTTLVGGMASAVALLAGLLVLMFLFSFLKAKNRHYLFSFCVSGIVAILVDSVLFSAIYMFNGVADFVQALINMAVMFGAKAIVILVSVPLVLLISHTKVIRFPCNAANQRLESEK